MKIQPDDHGDHYRKDMAKFKMSSAFPTKAFLLAYPTKKF